MGRKVKCHPAKKNKGLPGAGPFYVCRSDLAGLQSAESVAEKRTNVTSYNLYLTMYYFCAMVYLTGGSGFATVPGLV